jgi:hypothetical protein
MFKTSMHRMFKVKKNQNWRREVEVESHDKILFHQVRTLQNRLNKLEVVLEELKIYLKIKTYKISRVMSSL